MLIRLSEAYQPLTWCRDPFIFVEGPRGTAKTRSILTLLILTALQYPGSRLLLCRKYRAVLAETVLKTLQEEVLPIFGLFPPGGRRDNWRELSVDNADARFTMSFVGLDDSTAGRGTGGLLSSAYSRAYVAEAIELSEAEIMSIAGCMRWTRSDERPSLPEYAQVILDANPGAPSHWLNQKAEECSNQLRLEAGTREGYARLQEYNRRPAKNPRDRWKRIVTRHQDNIGYWDAEIWDYKPQGREYVTKNLSSLPGHIGDRWLKGLWKAAEGSVYPNFSDDVGSGNVWAAFNPPADWPMYWGIDPGMDHPAAVLWLTVAPTGELIVCGEIVESGKGTDELVPMIKELERARGWMNREITRYGDPQYSFSSTAMSKKTIAEQYHEHGLIMHPWPRTGDNMDGMVDAVRTRINARTLIIMDNCPKTIAAVQSWSFRRNADGTPAGAKGKDAYEEEYKDPNDVIRGIVADNPSFTQAKFTFDSNRRE